MYIKETERFDRLVFVSFTRSNQVNQQAAPLSPELVGSGQTAITSNHTQVGDPELHQVTGCFCAALPTSEVFAASAANDSAAL